MITPSNELCRKCICNYVSKRRSEVYPDWTLISVKEFNEWFQELLAIVAATGLGEIPCYLWSEEHQYKEIFTTRYPLDAKYGSVYYDYVAIYSVPVKCPYFLEHILSESQEKEYTNSVQ